ncbi:YlaN family protein [Paenibacillus pinistramenti]|uniref:YlaN family protein n=1 Tax=Paenibacillus pinistramenti TaxID=1768003 RepID=UPI001108220E|nr:YlaN family protein [Paenibacillus pinistramenti]
MTSSDLQEQLNLKALNLLQEDAYKIEKLIEVQMENLATRYCPLYEEVLDTQMFGFSKEVDFAVRAGLVNETVGKQILSKLERNLALLYEALNQKANQSEDGTL